MENGGLTKNQFEATGHLLIRYGLVLVIGWIGAMKFTNYEAHGIEPMVAHSPVMGWMYKFQVSKPFPACSASWRSLSPVYRLSPRYLLSYQLSGALRQC